MNKILKIDNPTEETVVLGGRTLKQTVALMERLTGMLEVVDISEPERRKSLVSTRSHFYANTKENLQWTMQHLTSQFVHVSGSGTPSGTSNWDMYIAHDVMPKGGRKVMGKFITSANLTASISRISYVITPEADVTGDIDRAEAAISSYEARLATIGEWKRLGLTMQVTCGCGRGQMLKSRESFSELPGDRETAAVIRRLKCKACGKSNVVETTPYNRKVLGPISYTDNPYINWGGTPSPNEAHHVPDRRPNGRENQFYVDLGGNGQDPVYVGDEIYMDSDGRLREY